MESLPRMRGGLLKHCVSTASYVVLNRCSAHAKWVEVETRPLRGGGRPVVRRMLRHNAIEAWQTMLKTGWVRCSPRHLK